MAAEQEAKHEIQSFFRDQLILPKEPSLKALGLLKRAEEVGMGGLFAIHSLSAVRLTQDTQVLGWDKKPKDWYWEQIANGNLSKDAAQLPGVEILIDITPRPNYQNGRQLHENDPLGPLLAKLRKDKKIETIKGIPKTSRFGISPDKLTTIVLPEMLTLLGEDASEVRLPTEIEFSVLGNFIYHHFGEVSTSEWLNDNFADSGRLLGGHSGLGGLARVHDRWSVRRVGGIGFRPLVVVSPKA